MTSPVEAVEILNRVNDADPSVLPALIGYRVLCNDALADDPTVQVGRIENDSSLPFEVGLLGIINGLFGVVPGTTHGYIAATFDADRLRVVRFHVLPREVAS